MNKISMALCVTFLALGLLACGKPLTLADNGKTLNLSVDDPVQVELEGNPTTGYLWELAPYDATVIKAIGEPDFKADSQATGAGGLFTYNFQTVADGQTVLKFVYRRPFEKDVPPIKTYELKIVVGTMGQILEH
ncbi:MAG TPA: hypothetical protein DCZ95_00450 [Verrucomicrobia bacterium]|nr:MAG: hypothetical protein A2X46_05915 [Lentisphaerae bacterium GWF2_57_35]HBA82539.1 hypothetical protein [Verrucomicrobiota bacterium]